MSIGWLFQTDVLDRSDRFMIDEAKRQGHDVKVASREDYFGSSTYLDLFEPNACVVVRGSIGFICDVNRLGPWSPGAICSFDNYDCSIYYPKLSSLLLAQEYCFIPFWDFKNKLDFLYKNFGESDAIFVRPARGDKPFTGQLFYRERFDKTYNAIDYDAMLQGDMIVVSPPRNVVNEWRFLVVGGKIVTGSTYRVNEWVDQRTVDLLESDPAMLAYEAMRMLRGNEPDPAYVIDIGQTKEGNYYVIELNSFSSSGLYACDPEPVVREVSRLAKEMHEEEFGWLPPDESGGGV